MAHCQASQTDGGKAAVTERQGTGSSRGLLAHRGRQIGVDRSDRVPEQGGHLRPAVSTQPPRWLCGRPNRNRTPRITRFDLDQWWEQTTQAYLNA
jgi:hypothetical protein